MKSCAQPRAKGVANVSQQFGVTQKKARLRAGLGGSGMSPQKDSSPQAMPKGLHLSAFFAGGFDSAGSGAADGAQVGFSHVRGLFDGFLHGLVSVGGSGHGAFEHGHH